MKQILFFSVIFILLSGSGVCRLFDGAQLKQLMDSDSQLDISMFRGYVGGVQDLNNGEMFCVHPRVKLSQAAAIVQKYFADNPQMWHTKASWLVVLALQKAFPCKK